MTRYCNAPTILRYKVASEKFSADKDEMEEEQELETSLAFSIFARQRIERI